MFEFDLALRILQKIELFHLNSTSKSQSVLSLILSANFARIFFIDKILNENLVEKFFLQIFAEYFGANFPVIYSANPPINFSANLGCKLFCKFWIKFWLQIMAMFQAYFWPFFIEILNQIGRIYGQNLEHYRLFICKFWHNLGHIFGVLGHIFDCFYGWMLL